MNRSTFIRRGKPLRRSNPKRKELKFARNFSGGDDFRHDEYIRRQPCCVCWSMAREQKSRTEQAHVNARGMGGAGGTWKDTVPLCSTHHLEQGYDGNAAILEKYGVHLPSRAAELVAAHVAAHNRNLGALNHPDRIAF